MTKKTSARQGDWVLISRTVLEPDERTSQLPPETARTPLTMRVKGYLISDIAAAGEEVDIETVTGRRLRGTLTEIEPTWEHGFGAFVPELQEIGRRYREDAR